MFIYITVDQDDRAGNRHCEKIVDWIIELNSKYVTSSEINPKELFKCYCFKMNLIVFF